jgi:D-alanine-D-alanine ligase
VTGSSRPASRIVVLMGGPSAEREVSLSTGQGCAEALRSEGYDVVEVDAGPDLASRLADIKPDVVFNALHGSWGEDGCVQGMLEWLRIPYTHSGVLASSLGHGQGAHQGRLPCPWPAGGRQRHPLQGRGRRPAT